MRNRVIVCASLALMFWGSVFPMMGQVPTASQLLPPGFKLMYEQKVGGASQFTASRSNANFPKNHVDPGITFAYSWQANPFAARTVEMIAHQPEEPAAKSMGLTRVEPAGKLAHKGGVLIWRKTITPWVGAGNGADLVTLSGSWIGVAADGFLSVGVSNFFGPKEAALAWINSVVDKTLKK